jgi:hypothetical protein
VTQNPTIQASFHVKLIFITKRTEKIVKTIKEGIIIMRQQTSILKAFSTANSPILCSKFAEFRTLQMFNK